MKKAKPNYKQYIAAMSSLQKAQGLPLIYSFGESRYLMDKTIDWLRIKHKGDCVKIGADKLTESDLTYHLRQDSIFSSSAGGALVITKVEKKPSVLTLVHKFGGLENTAKQLVLMSNSKVLVKAAEKLLQDSSGVALPCFDPNLFELPAFLRALAKKHGLKIDESAAKALISAVGTNLTMQENEIKRLALIFYDAKEELKAKDLDQFLHYLKEDHAFVLDSNLVKGQLASAHLLLRNLLARGQSHLAILGFLRLHCMKALQILEFCQKGASQSQMLSQIRMPPKALGEFIPYVQKAKRARFENALTLCAEADILFKSTRRDPELILGRIMDSLAEV